MIIHSAIFNEETKRLVVEYELAADEQVQEKLDAINRLKSLNESIEYISNRPMFFPDQHEKGT